VSAISCGGIDLNGLLARLSVARAHFPIKYLGLSLSTRRLRRVDLQPQVDKAASRLSTWYGRNLNQAGRVCLTKAVLSSQPVYLLTVINPPKEILQEIDKIRKCFLWAGDKAFSSGKCKVNWTKTTLSKEYGGLGVLNLNKFATTLHMRWLWHEWASPDKPWVGMEVTCTEDERRLFASCTTITLGDGTKANFWNSAWLNGQRPRDIAPLLFSSTRRKTARWRKPYGTAHGSATSTIGRDSPCCTYYNSWSCGILSHLQSSTRNRRIPSYGI
jgi:hypothetical protein